MIHSNNDVLCITELRPRSTVKAVGGSLVAGVPCNSVGVGGVVLEQVVESRLLVVGKWLIVVENQIGNLVDITI